MVTKISEQDLLAKASKGLIKDYYSIGKERVLQKRDDFADLKGLLSDSTFNSQVNALTNAILKGGFRINKAGDVNNRELDKENKFRKYGWWKIKRHLCTVLITYRNAFIEIKKGNPRELHVLETTQMEIRSDEHGDILGYLQRVEVPSNISSFQQKNSLGEREYIPFSEEEVVHIPVTKIDTNPWGYIDTRTIKDLIVAKTELEAYIALQISENRYRDIYILKNASGVEQVKNFVHALKESRLRTDKDIVVEGDVEQKQLRDMADIDHMITLYDSYVEAIREFLTLPSVITGGDTEKSSAEFQVRYGYDNTVEGWRSLIADYITHDMFPKLSWEGSEFSFDRTDKIDEKNIIQNAVQLQSIGFDSDTIQRYLIESGVNIPAGAEIEEPEPDDPLADAGDQTSANLNSPSRQPASETTVGKDLALDNSTREDQIVGKGRVNRKVWGNYPYIIG